MQQAKFRDDVDKLKLLSVHRGPLVSTFVRRRFGLPVSIRMIMTTERSQRTLFPLIDYPVGLVA